MVIGFPLLGAAIGWSVHPLAHWVLSLSWAPFQGPLELFTSIPQPLATIATVVLGTSAGLAVAGLAERDNLTVSVADDHVTFIRGRGRIVHTIPRASLTAVFVEGNRLVLLGEVTQELADEESDVDRDQLQEGFRAHGYPWHPDGDPFKDAYRRWVEDLPDLTSSANALLRARARAIGKSDHYDAAELRKELARLGVVVRDRNKRQFWRRTTADSGEAC